jgi:hypothetical protein
LCGDEVAAAVRDEVTPLVLANRAKSRCLYQLLPWQIVPSQISDWLNGDDPAMAKRVTSKVWAVEELDLAELQRAARADR